MKFSSGGNLCPAQYSLHPLVLSEGVILLQLTYAHLLISEGTDKGPLVFQVTLQPGSRPHLKNMFLKSNKASPMIVKNVRRGFAAAEEEANVNPAGCHLRIRCQGSG
jgi:hypothetical protein